MTRSEQIISLVKTMSYQQVAQALGITKGMVAGIVFRSSEANRVKHRVYARERYREQRKREDEGLIAFFWRDPRHEPTGCRWIEGDVRTKDWHYCQHDRVSGELWCEEHRCRVYLSSVTPHE